MGIFRTEFLGNPNVGLFGYASEDYCLLGERLHEREEQQVAAALEVETHRIRLCGTALLGVFAVGNSSCLLVPEIAFDHEVELLEELSIPFVEVDTELTALGNNILANDKGCIISPDYPKEVEKAIHQALDVPVRRGTILGLHNIGALSVSTPRACVVPPDTTEEERKTITDTLKVEIVEGTANLGMPYLRAAVIANSKGMVIGSASSGVEIATIDNAFFSR